MSDAASEVAAVDVRSVDRFARSIAAARFSVVALPTFARWAPSPTFMSGMAAAVASATALAPRSAVVATAVYRLRGGVGARRQPIYRSRSFREVTPYASRIRSCQPFIHRTGRSDDGWRRVVLRMSSG